VLLRRAHPDIFDDALWAVINKAKQQSAAGAGQRSPVRKLQKGVRPGLVPARKPSMRPGWYCIRRSRVLTSAVRWAMSRLARLARDRFRCDPDRLDGVELGGAGGELEDRQPFAGCDDFAHCPADVGVQVVPDQDERPAGRLVRGVQEPGAVRLGEPLALVPGSAALVDAVDQPGPLPGLHRDQRGQPDPLAAATGYRHHRGPAATAPAAVFGGLKACPDSSSKTSQAPCSATALL
jgi:hypothetical protein